MQATDGRHGFSLPVYLLIVFAVSWPFQFLVFIWPDSDWSFRMLLVAMVMVSVGTYVAGRYVFHDTFADAGWRWGKPIHYVAAFSLPVVLWVVPTLIDAARGAHDIPSDFDWTTALTTFLLYFTITLIPAFGEEFGWRGYLLPRLAAYNTIRKALLMQAVIWWTWHLPFLVFLGIDSPIVEDNVAASVSIMLLVSVIPSLMHAIVYAYFWSKSGSLAVVTAYHAAFDETRDTVEDSVGFGPISQLWQMLLLTFLGAMMLWKGKWERLRAIREGTQSPDQAG